MFAVYVVIFTIFNSTYYPISLRVFVLSCTLWI